MFPLEKKQPDDNDIVHPSGIRLDLLVPPKEPLQRQNLEPRPYNPSSDRELGRMQGQTGIAPQPVKFTTDVLGVKL